MVRCDYVSKLTVFIVFGINFTCSIETRNDDNDNVRHRRSRGKMEKYCNNAMNALSNFNKRNSANKYWPTWRNWNLNQRYNVCAVSLSVTLLKLKKKYEKEHSGFVNGNCIRHEPTQKKKKSVSLFAI